MRRINAFAVSYLMAAPAVHADMFFEATATAIGFDYMEFDQNGVFLDKENGVIIGRSVSIGYIDKLVSHIIKHTRYDGAVDYIGKTVGVSPQPLNTQTQAILSHTSYRQIWKNLQHYHGVTVYLDLSHSSWSRNILPTATPVASSGLKESYDWFSVEVGIFLDIIRTAKHAVEVGYGKFKNLDSTISVLLKGNAALGTNDDITTFGIGDQSGNRYTIAYRYKINHDYIVSVIYDKIDTGFGANDTIVSRPPTGLNTTVVEPASNARHATVNVSLAVYF